jgi:hypothetical protein
MPRWLMARPNCVSTRCVLLGAGLSGKAVMGAPVALEIAEQPSFAF